VQPGFDGQTYALRCTVTGRVKIGRTTSWTRFGAIQSCSPTELEFLGWLDIDESTVHRMLKPWRLHNEWFTGSDQVMAVIRDWWIECAKWEESAA